MTADPDDFDDDAETLVKQFPPRVPSPPNLEMSDVPDDVYYPDGPPVLVPVTLLKEKYSNRLEALIRARELCQLRGLKFVRMFETGRAYVAHCHRPKEPS